VNPRSPLDDLDTEDTYKVVLNDEEQYAIWPDGRATPPGWRDAGRSGSKAQCLAYVKEAWTDLRPRSLRERMAASVDSDDPPFAAPRPDRAPNEASVQERKG
jgi:MbtH protein